MKYKIFVQELETICVPATDYYSRSGDWETEYSTTLKPITDKLFDSTEEAIKWLQEGDEKGEFLFIPTYAI